MKSRSIQEKVKRMQMHYTFLGAAAVTLGLGVGGQSNLPPYWGVLISAVGGFIIGFCFRNIVENMLYCDFPFYEFMMKIELENGQSARWKPTLMFRFITSLLGAFLILALLMLPLTIRLRESQPIFLYGLGVVYLMYRCLKCIHHQVISSVQVYKRALDIDKLFEDAQKHPKGDA